MAATLTVTGVAGPGQAVTALVIPNVSWFSVDAVGNVLNYTLVGNNAPQSISVNAATTVTSTKSGSTWTLTIS